MINFVNRGTKYSIRFFYENADNPEDKSPLENVVNKRVRTVCKIAQKNHDGYIYLVEGISVNHSRDLFKKDSGRKLALAKALQQLLEDRDRRKEFWMQYFNHHKEGRKLIQSGKV